MRVNVALVTLAVHTARAVWISDVFSPNGWQFGDNMSFQIEDSKIKNATFFDRLGYRVKYGDYEINAVQNPTKNAVQLDFYTKDIVEGKCRHIYSKNA